MSNYSKHKDRAPQDTIFEIQRILNSVGVFSVVKNIDKEFDGAVSNRVTIYPTEHGTNGKGTDELFATASGYAELIERIQNNLLVPYLPGPRLENYSGFIDFPDEKEFSLEELIEQKNPYIENIFSKFFCYTYADKMQLLLKFNEILYDCTDAKIKAIPFADPFNNKLVYIPMKLAFIFCGSNGMAAGNTLEEAFVQGMSEIFERYVNRAVILGEVVPPEIPLDYLKKYSFWDLIQKIESGGRYKVSVRDCSMNKNFPVAATIIFDRERGTFGVKFGSHPSLAVAIERTLTEAFQGRKLLQFTDDNRIGGDKETSGYNNVPNVTKVGIGYYSYKMLTEKPDYEFKEWTYWQGLSNREFFKKMLELIKAEGYQPLFRDSSHLGFPACYIIVPGMSEAFHVNQMHLREMITSAKNYKAFYHFPNISAEEETRLLRTIKFKEDSILDNQINLIAKRPIKEGVMSGSRIAAFISLKHGIFADAMQTFLSLSESVTDENERRYFSCLTEFTRLLNCGIEIPAAHKVISLLFDSKTAERVIYETEDFSQMLQRAFPQMNCYDCEHCELSGKYCTKFEDEKIFMKIKDAIGKSKVSQAALLDYLKNI